MEKGFTDVFITFFFSSVVFRFKLGHLLKLLFQTNPYVLA